MKPVFKTDLETTSCSIVVNENRKLESELDLFVIGENSLKNIYCRCQKEC